MLVGKSSVNAVKSQSQYQKHLERRLSAGGSFDPQRPWGSFGNVWNHFCQDLGGRGRWCATGLSWVEPQDPAKHPATHRTALTVENHLARSAEEPSSRVMNEAQGWRGVMLRDTTKRGACALCWSKPAFRGRGVTPLPGLGQGLKPSWGLQIPGTTRRQLALQAN